MTPDSRMKEFLPFQGAASIGVRNIGMAVNNASHFPMIVILSTSISISQDDGLWNELNDRIFSLRTQEESGK